jgi:hypothetical protein
MKHYVCYHATQVREYDGHAQYQICLEGCHRMKTEATQTRVATAAKDSTQIEAAA